MSPYLRTDGRVCECVVVHNGETIVQEVPRGALLLMGNKIFEHLKATENDGRPCDTEAA